MNLEDIAKRIIAWSEGEPQDPEFIQIYPTNKCNLKCVFCVQKTSLYQQCEEVSRRRWIEITKELCSMNIRRMLISGGGEPLATPETTLKIMELIKKCDIEGRIITNGTLWCEKSIKKTVKMGWDCVVFSIDGIEGVHDFLRGVRGTFQKVRKNIEIFNKYKKRKKSTKPVLGINFVLTSYNYEHLPKVIEFAGEYGIEDINIEPVCVNNPEVEKMKLNKEMRERFFNNEAIEAEKKANEYGIRTNLKKLQELRYIENTGHMRGLILKKMANENKDIFNVACFEPWIWPKIEANGEVWPCSTIEMKENIKEKKFKEVWFGEEFNKFREMVKSGNLPRDCNNCVFSHLYFTKEIKEKIKKLRSNG
ncbi:MAG: radical SAM protein [Candidatus Aenigmatarchaeota archaeon]